MPDALHLVKVALRADRLADSARRRGLPLRDLDEGYLSHCLMREIWQEQAPGPFVLRGTGRVIEAWGYSRGDAQTLIQYAKAAEPSLLGALDGLDAIASRPMPALPKGHRAGFLLRACPVVRLAAARRGHAAGAEVDAFLARCLGVARETSVSREAVYREWLRARMGNEDQAGAAVERIAVTAMSRQVLVRRTQGEGRQARRLDRPDVRFAGELVVRDGRRLLEYLAHGVGRHRAFGFGALMLVPPGTTAVS
jgi:CRISPR system Cascade subunit CasE